MHKSCDFIQKEMEEKDTNEILNNLKKARNKKIILSVVIGFFLVAIVIAFLIIFGVYWLFVTYEYG